MEQSRDYQYHILSARHYGFPGEVEFRNMAFNQWFSFWSNIYEQSGSGYQLNPDEFIRQDLICMITCEGKVAALHLYSFFDLQSKPDTSAKYFQFFNPAYFQELKKRNVRSVMSMEFLTVFPEFKKSVIGFSAGSVIAEMGTRIFGESQADAIVAPARIDYKVHEMAYDIGFTGIQKNTIQRGFPCDLIACFQGDQVPSKLPRVHEVSELLWNQKVVHPSAEHFLSAVGKGSHASKTQAA